MYFSSKYRGYDTYQINVPLLSSSFEKARDFAKSVKGAEETDNVAKVLDSSSRGKSGTVNVFYSIQTG